MDASYVTQFRSRSFENRNKIAREHVCREVVINRAQIVATLIQLWKFCCLTFEKKPFVKYFLISDLNDEIERSFGWTSCSPSC